MITIREIQEKLRGMTPEELANELGTTPEWVKAVMDTDAFEYLERG